MRFRPGAAAVGLVALVSLGCSHGSRKTSAAPTHGPSSPTTGATTVAPGAGVVTTTTTTTSAQATTPTSNAGSGTRCASAALALSLSDRGTAAGTAYRELVFKNTSTRTCTMRGYPGISFLDARGRQVGAPVARMSGSDTLVTLGPGGTAAALIAYHDVYVSTFPNCQPTPAAGIQVFPPDETAGLTVPTNLMVCANRAATGAAGISPVTTPASLHP
ncbi:MAG: DUF4232 domain-containing protein [Actinomycetota bacterium]|nr:DUF4232 domain-containing protein [Actinomycetota bacterium]